MIDIKFFSIVHVARTSQDNMLMAVSSFVSFLHTNPSSDLTIVLLGCEGDEPPRQLRCLSSHYKSRVKLLPVPHAEFRSVLEWYSFRFSHEVGEAMGGGRLVYMDYDLYHLSSMEDLAAECDWERLNVAPDMSGYLSAGSQALQRSNHTSGRLYVNTGLAAWTHSACPALDAFRSALLTELAKEDPDDGKVYMDQDVLNASAPEGSINYLPLTYNYAPGGQSEHTGLTDLLAPCKTIGVRAAHIMSYHKSGVSSRLSPFLEYPRREHWYHESALPHYGRDGADIHIVVISHNQAKSLPPLGAYLREKFPGCPVTVVLDRCSDNSVDMARIAGFTPLINYEGSGFLAGRMRDKGLAASGMHDTLFLDGDRVPSMQFGYKEACVALAMFDLSLIPIRDGEFRDWFQDECFVPNKNYGEWGNDFFTCGLLARKSALESLTRSQEGLLFVKDFDGQFGEEDRYLGDVAHKLGLTCGGVPRKYALSGNTFRPNSDRAGVERNVAVRARLRASLGYQVDRGTTKEALRTEALVKVRNSIR